MNRRIDAKKKQDKSSKRGWLAALVTILFLVTAGIGLYITTSDSNSEKAIAEIKETSFPQRGYSGVPIAEIEAPEEPEETPPGTVNNNLPEKEEEEAAEEEEEPATEEEIVVEAPEEDLSSMVANAKTHVYTLYTDLEQGSGFLFNNQGDILTNAHVVKDAAYVTVKNSNGQEFNGRVIGISDTTDIALVRVEGIAGKEPLGIEMTKAPVGTPVFALGSPENISNTSTEGEITGTDKSFFDEYQYDNLYEMNAPIKRGSSGGPLISAESGNVLGINSIILTDQPEIGYAIPIYTIISQLNEWVSNPIPAEEEVQPDISDAYLQEELLRSFITDFYTLIPYSLNDPEIGYYLFFLLPGSQGEEAGQALVDGMMSEDRIFEAAEPHITRVEISDDHAIVTADAVFNFQNTVTGELESISHTGVYTVVIDEYGDYRISEMVSE